MTTTQITKDTDKTGTTAETPKKSRKGASSGSSPAGSEAGYAGVFKDWVFEPVEEGPADVDPKTLVNVADVRDQSGKIDDFLVQTKGGIKQSIGVTRAKFIGATGEYEVSPEPGKKMKLVQGTVYTLINFGRRRTRAGLAHGFKMIPAHIHRYANWVDFIASAFIENDARQQMSSWDKAVHLKNLRDGGATNEQIAKSLEGGTVTSGNVSHILGVFDLPAPVQKLYRESKITTTEVRALRPLMKLEGGEDHAIKLAMLDVEKGWTEDKLKEMVKAITNPPEKASKNAKTRVTRVDYSKVPIKPLAVAVVRNVLSNQDLQVQRAKQRLNQLPENAEVEKRIRAARNLGKQEGRLEAFLEANGVREVPESLTVAAPKEEEEEASS